MTRKTLVRAALALTFLAAPTACSSPAVEPAATHNAADVRFARDMVPHHEQAVDMAGLTEGRTTNPTVLDLAGRITKAQAPEIDLMKGWLQSWGEPATGHDGHDESAMTTLRAATGEAFDVQWLSMMITHHEGAIASAETELADGADPAAKDLARRIVDGQRAEIDEMHALLPQG